MRAQQRVAGGDFPAANSDATPAADLLDSDNSNWFPDSDDAADELREFVSLCEPLPGVVCAASALPFELPSYRPVADECQVFQGYHFASALLFSVFLGYCGIDRFYTGHSALAIVKLISLGGVGIWWAIDTILLIVGVYKPVDGNWEPFW